MNASKTNQNNSDSKEVWKEISGYEASYAVSNLGRVKSLARNAVRKDGNRQSIKEMILKPWADRGGYLTVSLLASGKRVKKTVHRLTAIAFIPNPDNLATVNHLRSKRDNFVEALEWASFSDNMEHAYKNGLMPKARKRVAQIDFQGTVVTIHASIKQAARQVNLPSHKIYAAISSKDKLAGGYRWRLVSDVDLIREAA